METANYTPDYAKFVFDCEQDYWTQLYGVVCSFGRDEAKYPNFLKEHRVSVFGSDYAQLRKYVLELWGDSTFIVLHLPFLTWGDHLRRFDVRHIEEELSTDMIQELGQLLQTSCSKYNINTYRTRAGSKRKGRDRGGVGYAIGSHKSQLRVTTYKRGSEAAATEAQCTGLLLKKAIDMARRSTDPEALSYPDPWLSLIDHIRSFGEHRINDAWKSYAKQLTLTLPPPGALADDPSE